MNLRHIPLENAHNFRDLGGYPTTEGRSTRWGMIYRSDALAGLTEADWQVLKERKVRTIIDLRSSSEATAAPIRQPEPMKYFHFSLMKNLDQGIMDPRKMSTEKIIESMRLDYVKTLFESLPCCGEILRTILTGLEEGSVVFLCSAGKDRTGIIAAVILYLCDVVREDIVADYIVSSTYNANGINKKLQSLPPEMLKLIPDMELFKSCMDSKPETIIALLEELEKRNIRKLLAEAGFSAAEQQELKEIFTRI